MWKNIFKKIINIKDPDYYIKLQIKQSKRMIKKIEKELK